MILAMMAFLSVIGVMKPFGIGDFEHDTKTHIGIIVFGLYLVVMFVVYLKYKNEFDNKQIVRYRILSLFLVSGWIAALIVFGSAMENAISLLQGNYYD